MFSLSSCIDDGEHDVAVATIEETSSSSELKLSFVIPNADVATRAPYEEGEGLENEINISDHDFRVYFFTYDVNDVNYEKGGTLLAEFTPNRTTSSSTSSETRYTVTGKVPNGLLEVDSFRVVVLANWGLYPEVEEGTTIDYLTEDTYSTFTAAYKFSLSSSQLIPFYGVQEFPGVEIKEGSTTTLDTPISLLRALAKVEIILDDDEDDEFSFSEVTLHNYNSTGYSAPNGVYLSSDYDHDGDWENDYVKWLHLVNNGENDATATQNSTNFIQTKARGVDESTGVVTYETWELYIPEYDNTSNIGTDNDDFSYITTVLSDGTDGDIIYFATYVEGKTDAYEPEGNTDLRLNIHRNNLYRFHVSRNKLYTSIDVVEIIPWVERRDNVEF